MKRIIAALALFLSIATQAFAASTSYQATLGSGAAFGAWCVGGSGAACTGGAFWPGTVITNSGGVELFTSGNAAYVQFPSAQAVNATLQASATTAIGKVDPNTLASWGLVGIGGGANPTNALVAGCTYNATPPTLTTGQSAGLQCNNNGELIVGNTNANITNGDGVSTTTWPVGSPVASLGYAFNGTSYDRLTSTKKILNTINGANTWNTIAASQTAQILSSTSGGTTGTTGDYLSHCVIQPTTTAAGTVTIADNATTVFTFTTGTLSSLVPIPVPVGAVSTSGGWKVTTGANESVTCYGKFT